MDHNSHDAPQKNEQNKFIKNLDTNLEKPGLYGKFWVRLEKIVENSEKL